MIFFSIAPFVNSLIFHSHYSNCGFDIISSRSHWIVFLLFFCLSSERKALRASFRFIRIIGARTRIKFSCFSQSFRFSNTLLIYQIPGFYTLFGNLVKFGAIILRSRNYFFFCIEVTTCNECFGSIFSLKFYIVITGTWLL